MSIDIPDPPAFLAKYREFQELMAAATDERQRREHGKRIELMRLAWAEWKDGDMSELDDAARR